MYFCVRFKDFADTDGGGSAGIISIKDKNNTGNFFQYIKLGRRKVDSQQGDSRDI